jgi:hypothetical protein
VDDATLHVTVTAWVVTVGLILALHAFDLLWTDILFALDSIHHARGRDRLRRQRVRAARPARAVLRRVGTARPARLLSSGLSLILAFISVKLVLHCGWLQDDSIPEIAIGTSLTAPRAAPGRARVSSAW